MKKFFSLILILLIAVCTSAQNYSTIHFVTNKAFKKNMFTVYLNQQMIATVNDNENYEYKVYSEGRVTITVLFSLGARFTRTADLKNGTTYYFELSQTGVKSVAEIIDEERGKELYAKNTIILKGEEDKKNPIGKISSASENEGPKQGSCFVLNKQGYLLTNNHVIDGAKTVQIKGIGNDFTTLYAADVIAKDIDLDLAVLKLKNQNISFENIPYHISDEISSQGTKALVLGYPMTSSMGEEIKITEGIINAKSGYKGTLTQYQFSAAVQPGNSGSPLFNENGDVIGVINAKLKDAEGVGYALKSSYLITFLKNVDNFQLDKGDVAPLNTLSLSDKVSKLKGFIFIVKAE